MIVEPNHKSWRLTKPVIWKCNDEWRCRIYPDASFYSYGVSPREAYLRALPAKQIVDAATRP